MNLCQKKMTWIYQKGEYVPCQVVWWMRSSQVVKASGCQCQSRNSPGFDPCVESEGRQMKHCWISYIKSKIKKSPFRIFLTLAGKSYRALATLFQAWKQGILQRAVDAGFLQYAKFLQAPNHAWWSCGYFLSSAFYLNTRLRAIVEYRIMLKYQLCTRTWQNNSWILVNSHSRHKLESFHARVFVWFSTLQFSLLQDAIHE